MGRGASQRRRLLIHANWVRSCSIEIYMMHDFPVLASFITVKMVATCLFLSVSHCP